MPTVTRLFRKSDLGLCTVAVCTALTATPALSAVGSFSIPTHATFVTEGAIQGATILLPHTGTPSFDINFVLPRDYATDQPVRIVVYLSSQSACRTHFTAQQMARKRPNADAVTGLAGLNGGSPTVDFSNILRIVPKTFTLNPGGPLPQQKPGDAFTIEFRRQGGHADDTCGSVFVHAIDIRYTLRP